MAYATLMRYFPGLWLFGIAAKAVHALFTRRDIPIKRFWMRVPMRYYQIALGFFLTIFILEGASMARDGVSTSKQSLENMFAHVQPHNLSSRREGLSVTLTYRGETDMKLISKEKKELDARIEPTVRVVSIFILIVFGLFMSRGKDWEVMGLGLIPYFMLTTSSYYYYVLRLTGVVVHAADLSKRRNAIGLAILFFIEVVTNGIEQMVPGNRYLLISMMGILLIIYGLLMIGWFGYDWWIAHKEAALALPVSGAKSKSKKK